MDPQFPDTPWSLIAQAQGGYQERQAALQQLLQRYWQPVYATLVGGWSLEEAEARQLAERFIQHLLSPDVIRMLDKQELRFRDFLRDQLLQFMQDPDLRRASGGSATGDLRLEDPLPLPPSHGAPGEVFDEQWVLLMFHRALARMRRSYEAERESLWQVFHAVDVLGQPLEAAASEASLRYEHANAMLFRARRQFRGLLIADLGEYCSDTAQTREELRWLLN